MHIEYDVKANAVYILLDPSKKATINHTREAGPNVLIDYADVEETQVVGIGIHDASNMTNNMEGLKSIIFELIEKKQ